MFAKWLRLGLQSARITTTYPRRRFEVLETHRLWRGLPDSISVPSALEAERLVRLCPTKALTLTHDRKGMQLSLDRGACITCGRCIESGMGWDDAIDLATLDRKALFSRQPIEGGTPNDERG